MKAVNPIEVVATILLITCLMMAMMMICVNADANNLPHAITKETNLSNSLSIPWPRPIGQSEYDNVIDVSRRGSVISDYIRKICQARGIRSAHIIANLDWDLLWHQYIVRDVAVPISSTTEQIWPDLELNWRVVVGTVIAFVGGSLGCAGGIGGGGIFVPMLVLVIGFDQKSATALSKCMIMGASLASVWYNFRLKSPILDYDLALVFQPMLMLGISIGVIFNVIFPNWIVTILLLVLFVGTSVKSFVKAISLYKRETIEINMLQHCKIEGNLWSSEAGGEYAEILEPHHLDESNSIRRNWRSLLVLSYVWISFLVLQILVKKYTQTCSTSYWVLNILQVPVAALVFVGKALQLYFRHAARWKEGERDKMTLAPVNAAKDNIKWSLPMLCMCAMIGLLAGTVGGLLGLGGGFILAPVYLELGVPPEIGSATASFVMLFSSSMSVIEYQLLHRFPLPFALYLFVVNLIAGLWAQIVLRRIIVFFRRTSIIIFIVSFVIFVSAICLGGYGIEDSLNKLQDGEYMGFVNLCTS